MKNNQLISVIVPIYNVAEYLPRCIESIQKQTYRNLQIILVDDGSTDESGRICDEYAKKDMRTEVLHIPNGGLVKARKTGLHIAKGKYIGFVDGDDYIADEMYEMLMGYMEKEQVDFVHTGFFLHDGNDKKKQVDFEEELYQLKNNRTSFLRNQTMIFHNVSKGAISNSIWSKLFKAELIQKIYSKVPDDQQFGEDAICLCACLLEADSFWVVPEAYYYYTVRENSITNSDNNPPSVLIKHTGIYSALKKLTQEYGYYEELKKDLDEYLLSYSMQYVEKSDRYRCFIERYSFPHINELLGKKIVLYGAGRVGQNYYNQLTRYDQTQIVAWLDRDYDKYHFDYRQVEAPERIGGIDFDQVLIAVANSQRAEEIRADLVKLGVAEEKILWEETQNNF